MTSSVASTARVYDIVRLGADSVVEDFCLLGQLPTETTSAQLLIGDHALVRSHTVLYAGSRIGSWFQTGHGVLVRQDCSIGDHCSIGSGSVVEFSVTIGHRVRLHSRCFVPEYTILEDDCWLGPGVILTNARYPASPSTKQTLEGVRVARNARVGAGVTILPGVTIGAGALVGAGAVVTRDVESGTVVAGTPAKRLGLVHELRTINGPVYPEHPG